MIELFTRLKVPVGIVQLMDAKKNKRIDESASNVRAMTAGAKSK